MAIRVNPLGLIRWLKSGVTLGGSGTAVNVAGAAVAFAVGGSAVGAAAGSVALAVGNEVALAGSVAVAAGSAIGVAVPGCTWVALGASVGAAVGINVGCALSSGEATHEINSWMPSVTAMIVVLR